MKKNTINTFLFLKKKNRKMSLFLKYLKFRKIKKTKKKILFERYNYQIKKNIRKIFNLSLIINKFKPAPRIKKLRKFRKNKLMKKCIRYRFKHRVAREVRRIRYLSIKRRITGTNA